MIRFYLIIFLTVFKIEFLDAKITVIPSHTLGPQHEKPLIILDPGHGGADPGARSLKLIEKNLTLMTALLVRNHLLLLGYRVIMTRNADIFIPLHRRVSIANETKAALFVSIHYNSCRNPEARGVDIFYHGLTDEKRRDRSKKLGTFVLKEMGKVVDCQARTVRKANFYVIKHSLMPAILIEAGFITNRMENMHLSDQRYIAKLAKAIADGIDNHLKS